MRTHVRRGSRVWMAAGLVLGICLLILAFGSQTAHALILNGNRPREVFARDVLDGVVEADQQLGLALAWGDYNGDTIEDLAIGVPHKRLGLPFIGGLSAGQVGVLYGSPLGLGTRDLSFTTFSEFLTDSNDVESGDQFGYALASGDFDGDGYDDLVVGVNGEDRTVVAIPPLVVDVGRVVLIYGGPSGLGSGRSTGSFMQSNLGLGANEEYDQFGEVLAAGDINGDGYDDVVCGTPQEDIVSAGDDIGAVEILYGGPTGITASGNQVIEMQMFGVHSTGMGFGGALAVGDFDGDGFDDVGIGSPGMYGSNVGYGQVLVSFGSAAGIVTGTTEGQLIDLPGVTGETAMAADHFGFALSSDDYDGDGFADLAIGAPERDVSGHADAGMIYVAFGGVAGFMSGTHAPVFRAQSFDQTVLPALVEAGDAYGWALASGDLNRDGFADLIATGYGEDIGSTQDAGGLGVMFGSALGLNGGVQPEGGAQEDLGVGTSVVNDRFGTRLACGDGDGDGIDDLAVSVPYKDVSGINDAGEVCVMYGSGEVLVSVVAAPLSLPAVEASSVVWGDFSGDTHLDFLLTGWTGTEAISLLYQNDGAGSFFEVPTNLDGVFDGASAWADYDNDGDLDLLLTGYSTPLLQAGPVTALYRNDGGLVFTHQLVPFRRVGHGSVVWYDDDNDGRQDIHLTGLGEDGPVSVVYSNQSYLDGDETVTRFVPSEDSGDRCVYHSDVAFSAGRGKVAIGMSTSGPVFWAAPSNGCLGPDCLPVIVPEPGAYRGKLAFADLTGNGVPELIMTGATDTGQGYVTRILDYPYSPANVRGQLWGVSRGALAVGDCDNDGDQDILLTGRLHTGERVSTIFLNDGHADFSPLPISGLPAVDAGDVAWGDWDDDGVFEILLTGSTGTGRVAAMYDLTGNIPANRAPRAPGGLESVVRDGLATLSWQSAQDTETPQASLSYEIRVGTTPGGSEIVAAAADPATGRRRLVQEGSVGSFTTKTIAVPPGVETLYWSVQAVDGGFAGSPFSVEQAVQVTGAGTDDPPVPTVTALHQNRPNPFNPRTTIEFDLAAPGLVDLVVYDTAGRRVRTLVQDSALPAGHHEVIWDGRNDRDRKVATGVYFYRLDTGLLQQTRRMTLLK